MVFFIGIILSYLCSALTKNTLYNIAQWFDCAEIWTKTKQAYCLYPTTEGSITLSKEHYGYIPHMGML